jgi:hypothetical protein
VRFVDKTILSGKFKAARNGICSGDEGAGSGVKAEPSREQNSWDLAPNCLFAHNGEKTVFRRRDSRILNGFPMHRGKQGMCMRITDNQAFLTVRPIVDLS